LIDYFKEKLKNKNVQLSSVLVLLGEILNSDFLNFQLISPNNCFSRDGILKFKITGNNSKAVRIRIMTALSLIAIIK